MSYKLADYFIDYVCLYRNITPVWDVTQHRLIDDINIPEEHGLSFLR
jgi:hypothetical protein